MRIFAISDLHLSLSAPFEPGESGFPKEKKPMSVFGKQWEDHTLRIGKAWRETVSSEDIVLIAGDISWAMKPEEARYDLDFISRLPGRKIMIKGNHDFCWHSVGKIRKMLPEGIDIIQNDAVILNNLAICGSRLWLLPSSPDFKKDDESIFRRELIRLELSLKAAAGKPVIAITLFMPICEKGEENEVIDLFRQYHVKKAVYGHLHEKSHAIAVEGEKHGISFYLTSADYVAFCPRLIVELEGNQKIF